MSKRKDKERFLREGPRPKTEKYAPKERVLVSTGEKKDKGPWPCFLCGDEISLEESEKLTRYAGGKPQFIVSKELGRMNSLLKGHDPKKARICTKCYKEKVERV